MKKYFALFFVTLFVLLNLQTCAQVSIRDSSISFAMLGATFQYQIPGGDMKERFYNNYNVGGVFQWKLKNNWVLGVEGGFIFNEEVKEDVLLNLRTHDGYIIGEDGLYAEVATVERGYMLTAKAGKIFPVVGPNTNSGLMTTIGVGFIQHKILISDISESVPETHDEYLKGYDRLTNGLSLTEFVGFAYFGNKRFFCFYAGFEFTQAFTQCRRDFNFDTRMRDDKQRLDLLSGIKFGWLIPIYKRTPNKYYYN
jgi:hypothetical protein